MAITKGQKVTVHYTGKLEDGSTFDSSIGKEPITFTLGEGQLIPGFENAVYTMSADEEKTVTIKPVDGYGEKSPEFLQKVEKSRLPQDQIPSVGMILGVSMPDGFEMPAEIVAVDDTTITLDFNHPLSGKTLVFTIKIIKVE
jgi:FKBP-type peptidyl-prolyl cis-trans isomerase SlpA